MTSTRSTTARRRGTPGSRWYWSGARSAALLQLAHAQHAAAVADHHHQLSTETDLGPAPAGLPAYGTTAELSGGATAAARPSTTTANR